MADQTMERIIPVEAVADKEGKSMLALHMERYEYAGKHLRPGWVVDIACGVGYGSHYLATKHGQQIAGIMAVDVDGAAVAYGREHYAHPLISFIQAEATSFQPAHRPSTIVCLETLEHLPDPESFFSTLAGMLKPGGVLIASVPITPTMDGNPFHLHDFTLNQFLDMGYRSGLQHRDGLLQLQRFHPMIALRKSTGKRKLRRNLAGFYFQNPGKLLARIRSLLVDGFQVKYYVGIFEKDQS